MTTSETTPPVMPPEPTPRRWLRRWRWMLGAAAGAVVVSAVVVANVRTEPDAWPAAAGATHVTMALPDALAVLGDDVIEAQVSDIGGTLSVLLPADSNAFQALEQTSAPGGRGLVVIEARFPLTFSDELVGSLLDDDVKFEVVAPKPKSVLMSLLSVLFPFALLGIFVLWIVRSSKKQAAAAALAQEVKSRDTQISAVPGTRFTDVIGADEAVEDLAEVVAYLKDPERFSAVGAISPKGVLLSGPPGCGKTLLARAVAGESGADFFSVAGSEFVEMYVGVGAKRVRDLFETARKSDKAIVFIDEIDAVGRARSNGKSPAHEERENTLNQLLVELDGFNASNVVVIAASNRTDLLDEALKRSGRFDREVSVSRPDRRGRHLLLSKYLGVLPLHEDMDLEKVCSAVSGRTSGLVGADMAVLANEAALACARAGRSSVVREDIEAAVERAQIGKARTSAIVSDKMRRIVAWHEAGHTVCALKTPGAPRPTRVSIVPRGDAGGVTWLDPGDDTLRTRSQWNAQLVVAFGGRAGESLILGDDVTHGASGDIISATSIAHKMVCEWGMSSLGQMYLAPEMMYGPTSEVVRLEITAMCERASKAAMACLEDNRLLVEAFVEVLLDADSIDETVIDRLDVQFPQPDVGVGAAS